MLATSSLDICGLHLLPRLLARNCSKSGQRYLAAYVVLPIYDVIYWAVLVFFSFFGQIFEVEATLFFAQGE